MGEESLRDNLEAAFDEDVSTTEVTEPSPVVDETPPVVDEPVVEEPAAAAEEPAAAAEETAASDDGTGEEKEEVVTEETTGEESSDGVKAESKFKPPYGWKPAMREKFYSLPEDVQGEILRREVDIAKGMEIAAEARKFKQEFDTHVAPYQAEIASRGVSAMDAFDNYLSTAYKLRHSPPQEKAALVGGLIEQYGIDIEILDQVLTNQINAGPKPGQGYNGGVPPEITHAVNQAMAPYQQFINAQQQDAIRGAERTQSEVRSEIEVFSADPKNEFYQDVREDMGNLLEAAAMRSTNMTLQEAYDRAILLRPDLAEIVAGRKLQEQAQSKDKAAKAAQARAVGVAGGSPDQGGRPAQPANLRSAIEAAYESNSDL